MYVCVCNGVTEADIQNAVNGGAESLREVREQLGVMTGCGTCASLTREIVKSCLESVSDSTTPFYEVA